MSIFDPMYIGPCRFNGGSGGGKGGSKGTAKKPTGRGGRKASTSTRRPRKR